MTVKVALVGTASEAAAAGEMRRHCAHVDTVVVRAIDRYRPSAPPALARWPLAMLPFYSPVAVARLRASVESLQPDIVQIEHSFLAPYLIAARTSRQPRTIISLHNVGFHQYEAMIRIATSRLDRVTRSLKAAFLRRSERIYLPQFEAVVVVSAREREILQRFLPGIDVEIVPNGVDTVTCRVLEDEPGGGLLFVGNLAYHPNVDAALYFCSEVLLTLRRTCPGLRLTIVGPQPPAAVRRLAQLLDVEVTGVVEQLEPYYQRARVCVVPLRACGGTRLKILEAMAYGRPVVSTRIGCEGLAVEKGRDILIADTPGEFSAEIMRLLHDAQLYADGRSNARRLVEEQYDWSHAANRLLALHARLTGQSSLCG